MTLAGEIVSGRRGARMALVELAVVTVASGLEREKAAKRRKARQAG
jgi:hypothetical protein